MGVIETVRSILTSPRTGVNDWRGRFSKRSYAQEGEDLILRRYLNVERSGFYVDVGAHHPIKFSNTYLFYKIGWSGINIDAMPGAMEMFRKLRPRDINIEAAVGKTVRTLTYTMFDEPALNTFDPGLAQQRAAGKSALRTVSLETRPLASILAEHLPGNQRIDFLSVDVEGLDLEALQSNDWERFRPTFVLVESSYVEALTVAEVQQTDIHDYLTGQGYELIAKSYFTTFYREGANH
ncbi:MAG: FkbM family methyltransferase [Bacteroidetes bacterium]|nr:FkbM family methyltransferase [Bacteroidota bacterium]